MERSCELLVVVDSSQAEYRWVAEGFLSAFLHFGMPYQLLDLAKQRLTRKGLDGASALVIAQKGIGGRLSDRMSGQIGEAVERDGLGLVSFDHRMSTYPKGLRRLLMGRDSEVSYSESTGLRIVEDLHFITQRYDRDEQQTFRREVEIASVSGYGARQMPLATTLEGHAALRVSTRGAGRTVQFLVSPSVWHSNYMGHFRGLDGLLWRSIVWAARKPFVLMMFPPLVACRVDDANGSANIFGKEEDSANRGFGYLETLNDHGYVPNLGLFVDDVTRNDGRAIRRAYDAGKAEFSAHALSDPRNVNEHPIYMEHCGREFSAEELRVKFARVDEKFAEWGVRQAKTVNAHFGEVGVNSLGFLHERGVRFMMSSGVLPGYTWEAAAKGECADWNPAPYGDDGFNYDRVMGHLEFFNAVSHPLGSHKLQELGMGGSDFLWWKTTFWDESPFNDIEGAAQKGAGIIKLGLDGGFFGCLLTHEQRIATLSAAEFAEILERIDRLVGKYPRVHKGYDYIAEYARSKCQARIVEAAYDPPSGQVRLKVSGETTLPLRVYLYADECGGCASGDIPSFEGEKDIKPDWGRSQ